MEEPDTRAFLLAMRRKLVKERENINKQIRACDTLLGGPPTEEEMQESPPDEAAARPPGRQPAPAASTSPPAAPASEPSPSFNEDERMKLLIRAGGNGRGAIQARVELIVAECGGTFSIRDVLPKYVATHGKDRYHLPESISSALWKLARKRDYLVVRKGSGTQPTIYRKTRHGQGDGNASGGS